MKLYFVKAQYTDGIYKLDDFYVGSNYRVNVNRMQDINLQANDGSTMTTVNTLLPDGSKVNDYSHVLVPEVNKIYEVDRCVYLNDTQTQISLVEDAFIGHYQEVKDKKLQIERSNDVSRFVGKLDIPDLAEDYVVSTEKIQGVTSETTGLWMMLSYQKDAFDSSKFKFGNIKNYGLIDEVPSLSLLRSTYPEITTTDPMYTDYFLKFVKVSGLDSGLYQCTYRRDKLYWRKVKEDVRIERGNGPFGNKSFIDTVLYSSVSSVGPVLGDIETVSVLLPIETGMVVEGEISQRFRMADENFTSGTLEANREVPSWYHLESIPPAGLISVRLIPDNLLNINTVVKSAKPVQNIDFQAVDAAIWENVLTYDFGAGRKVIENSPSLIVENTKTKTLFNLVGFSLKKGLVQDILLSSRPPFGAQDVKNYEPFKSRYLYMYGELISIPNRVYYNKDIRMRLIIDSSDTTYEIYTDNVVVLKSGVLPWYSRYQLDKLDIYQANNPTYKEQFWTNQISGAIKGITFGALKGPSGMATAALGSAMNIGTNALQMAQTEKGLRMQADQVMGINNLTLTMMKGFSVYWVTMVPEKTALEHIVESYQTQGFPTYFVETINKLTGGNTDLFGVNKLVKGQLLETVKNKYTTNSINRRLQEGVILI